jgi:hypothetical protein
MVGGSIPSRDIVSLLDKKRAEWSKKTPPMFQKTKKNNKQHFLMYKYTFYIDTRKPKPPAPALNNDYWRLATYNSLGGSYIGEATSNPSQALLLEKIKWTGTTLITGVKKKSKMVGIYVRYVVTPKGYLEYLSSYASQT